MKGEPVEPAGELEKAGSERRQRKTAVRQAFAEYGDWRRLHCPKGEA